MDYANVAVASPISFGYARYSAQPADWFVAQCLRQLLTASGLRKEEVDGLSVSSFTLPPNPVAGLSRSLGLCLTWLESIPFGGASGVMALRRAARAVQAGDASVVACIGADTNRPGVFEELICQFSTVTMDAVYRHGGAGPTMPFAHLTQQYMQVSGARREDFGALCVSQRFNAAHCDHALLHKPLSLQDYLEAPEIASPLHKFDLVMPCAGADGFLVLREDHAKRLQIPYARVKATVERHNAFAGDELLSRGGWELDRSRLYAAAGCTPAQIDVVATYDDCPAVVFMQLEGLGICPPGCAAEFVISNDLTFKGNYPHNTGGGQLGCGQAGAAGGFVGMVETLRQLTGQAHGRQVEGPRLGLVGGYGMAIYDRCLATGAAILEAA